MSRACTYLILSLGLTHCVTQSMQEREVVCGDIFINPDYEIHTPMGVEKECGWLKGLYNQDGTECQINDNEYFVEVNATT